MGRTFVPGFVREEGKEELVPPGSESWWLEMETPFNEANREEDEHLLPD